MSVAFYDTRDLVSDTEMVNVERVYCLDWPRFGETEWSDLDRIYRELPGWVGYREVPYWFGDDEAAPHLFASVEPSGLQVCGVLPTSAWLAWESRFGLAIAKFPSFEVD